MSKTIIRGFNASRNVEPVSEASSLSSVDTRAERAPLGPFSATERATLSQIRPSRDFQPLTDNQKTALSEIIPADSRKVPEGKGPSIVLEEIDYPL